MTEIEAINFINERIAFIKKHYEDIAKYREALEMSAKALEKQIPKKLKEYKPSKYEHIPVCGVCNGIMDLFQGELNYCPNCGQRIDFGE